MLVSSVSRHTVAGGLRESPLQSAEIDAVGTAYVAWADCRFRTGCARNDIVVSESTSELPSTTQGRMFGDYISTSVLPAGRAYPPIGVAKCSSLTWDYWSCGRQSQSQTTACVLAGPVAARRPRDSRTVRGFVVIRAGRPRLGVED